MVAVHLVFLHTACSSLSPPASASSRFVSPTSILSLPSARCSCRCDRSSDRTTRERTRWREQQHVPSFFLELKQPGIAAARRLPGEYANICLVSFKHTTNCMPEECGHFFLYRAETGSRFSIFFLRDPPFARWTINVLQTRSRGWGCAAAAHSHEIFEVLASILTV